MTRQYYNLGGLNTYQNPLSVEDGALIHAINVQSDLYGAKTKRPGYVTYLGTPDASQVNSLFSWTKNDGTTQYTYRASGSALYYSAQGTGAWTLASNGTITNGGHFGQTVVNNVLIGGDGVGSTRHTANGTAFTNTTLAPIAEFFNNYQGRVYAGGTSSTLFYSVANDATNWALSGTSDSSSFSIPGPGKLSSVLKVADRIVTVKNSGIMHKWDGYALSDLAVTEGPTSPYSVASKDGYFFWLTRDGIYGYGGDKPQIISNPIQDFIYNSSGSAITGSTFDTAPGACHRYDYLLSVGTITPKSTGYTIEDAILKYDYNKNEHLIWKFANKPTSMHSYTDLSGDKQLIFGDASGQCYKLSGTATSDNGSAIEAQLEYVVSFGGPEYDKKWHTLVAFFNPGCKARIAVACSDTFNKDSKKWVDLGDTDLGKVVYRFPSDSRSSLLFIRISESSINAPFTFYGFAIEADVIPLR